MIWLDGYDRKARLIPGLLVVVPIVIVVGSLGLRQQPMVVLVGGLLGTVGFPVLLASTVRAEGLKMQDQLFSKWGGAPTTVCLRHRGDASQARRREQWRKAVTQALGHQLPTAADEVRDPADADGHCDAAVSELRELTRDPKRFPLVFEENCNFGFERNLLAMRFAGLIVAGASCLTIGGSGIVALASNLEISGGSGVIGLLVCLALLAVWLWLPSEERVRRIGFRYAERLLDAAGQTRNGSEL